MTGWPDAATLERALGELDAAGRTAVRGEAIAQALVHAEDVRGERAALTAVLDTVAALRALTPGAPLTGHGPALTAALVTGLTALIEDDLIALPDPG